MKHMSQFLCTASRRELAERGCSWCHGLRTEKNQLETEVVVFVCNVFRPLWICWTADVVEKDTEDVVTGDTKN